MSSSDEDLSDDSTQQIGDGDDDFPLVRDTMHVDDTFLLEDDFETQLVDLSGETQVLELNRETQVLDDIGYLKRMPADMFNEFDDQVAAGSDSEGTDKNEVMCDTQVVSLNDPVNVDGGDSHGRGKGSLCGGFTAIRVAAVRASGIAAQARERRDNLCFTSRRVAALRESGMRARARAANKQSCFSRSDESSMGQTILEQVREEPGSVNSQEAGTKVARKLFMEEGATEVDPTETDINERDDTLEIPEVLDSENGSPGLSYTSSQPPGDLTQANALEVVDRFLELNAMECDLGYRSQVCILEKGAVDSGAKGSRDLAKSVSLKSTVGLSGVYDWDDTCEDEGGGDFLQKNKELFFSKEDLKLSSKTKSLYSGDLLFRKNLAKDFHEQRDLASDCRGPNNNTGNDIPPVENIGPDTQIAAEAMETLSSEVNLDSNDNCPNKGSPDMTRGTKRNHSSNRATDLEQNLTNPARVGVLTRQAKNTMRTSISTSNEPSSEKPRKRRRLAVRNNGDLVNEKERIRSDIRSSVHENDSHRGTKSAGRMPRKKSCLQEQHVSSVPVAHRTRKNTQLNHSEVAGDNTNDLTNAPDFAKKRRVATNKNAQVITIQQLRKLRSTGFKQPLASEQFNEKSAETIEPNGRPEVSNERSGKTSTCTTPARGATPVNNVSPICMGDEYYSQTCRESMSRFSLKKEVSKLINGSPVSFGEIIEPRKRRQAADTRVLFSQHLNLDVVKQQKKILARLGAAVASSMSDASHFVAGEFVRTRNMLEAIACGKPVVTHLWLESCGQAGCLIDERNYILRDVKKEKDFGFSMEVSLSKSCQRPLLQGRRVLVTPNTKPGKDTLANLIKAVHGLGVERLGRSVFNEEKLPDDLLVLSCEEDYDICVPFLEKGGAVYSSELLLNGIVKQKLEFERHHLFADHVKKTRGTIWVRMKDRYRPVTKCK